MHDLQKPDKPPGLNSLWFLDDPGCLATTTDRWTRQGEMMARDFSSHGKKPQAFSVVWHVSRRCGAPIMSSQIGRKFTRCPSEI